MCRLGAYTGPPIALDQLFIKPEHSLLKQSWAPQEMEEALLNADGFGFSWYLDKHTPATYTNTCPMWVDHNLNALGKSLVSNIWLASVRSATPGLGVNQDNTQPFTWQNLTFMHNGFIRDFQRSVRAQFHRELTPEIQATINGHTDSEYLFALFRQCLQTSDQDQTIALTTMIEKLPDLLQGQQTLFNVIIYNGSTFTACRYAFNDGNCPSLYFTQQHPDFPESVIIASERFSNDDCWESVASYSLLNVDEQRQVQCLTL